MTMIDRIQFTTGEAIGDAGNATATGHSQPISGRVLAVSVHYQNTPPVTTTLLVFDENDPTTDPIVQLFNTNSDRKLYPRRAVSTSDGTDVLYSDAFPVYDHFVAYGRLSAVLSLSNPGCSALVTVWLER
jgi:hypothetical protein